MHCRQTRGWHSFFLMRSPRLIHSWVGESETTGTMDLSSKERIRNCSTSFSPDKADYDRCFLINPILSTLKLQKIFTRNDQKTLHIIRVLRQYPADAARLGISRMLNTRAGSEPFERARI